MNLDNLRKVILQPGNFEMTDVNFDLPFTIPLQAGFWIQNSTSDDGVVGAALVSVTGSEWLVHSPAELNTLELEKTRYAKIVIPIQNCEIIEHGLKEDLDAIELTVLIEFLGSTFDDDVRYSKFKISKALNTDLSMLSLVIKLFEERNRIYSALPTEIQP